MAFKNRIHFYFLLLATATCYVPLAFALPQGGVVADGQVNINQSAPNYLTINQSSDKAIINWNSFDIQQGETTRFVQPSSNAIALNRVTGGGSASQILGSLSANGHVWVVNPNGVFFGSNATVDVAGLVATTANISDQNFLDGHYHFDTPGNSTAAVVNQGTITAADYGLVALFAPGAANYGTVGARLGTIGMGSAQTFTLDFYGDNLYSFALGQQTSAQAIDALGNTLSAGVLNSGTLSAAGGHILLSADVASNVVANAINMSGIIQARSASADATGTVSLNGGMQGAVTVSGKIDVSGNQTDQRGGYAEVLGDNITLASAGRIDATGSVGGGQVRIGGNETDHTVWLAHNTTVQAGSLIDVSATYNGDAGKVTLWSGGTTEFRGGIMGTGAGGNGGTVYVDAFGVGDLGGNLIFHGFINLSAVESVKDGHAGGAHGNILIDPAVLTIWSGAGDVNHINNLILQAILDTGTNIISQASSKYYVYAPVVWNSSASLTLISLGDMEVHAPLTSHGSGNITLTAARDVLVASNVHTNSGNVYVNARDVVVTGTLASTAGDVVVNNTGGYMVAQPMVEKTDGPLFKKVDGIPLYSAQTGSAPVHAAQMDATQVNNAALVQNRFQPGAPNVAVVKTEDLYSLFN